MLKKVFVSAGIFFCLSLGQTVMGACGSWSDSSGGCRGGDVLGRASLFPKIQAQPPRIETISSDIPSSCSLVFPTQQKQHFSKKSSKRRNVETSSPLHQPLSFSKRKRTGNKKIIHALIKEQQPKTFECTSKQIEQQKRVARAAHLKALRYNGKYSRHLGWKPGPNREQLRDQKLHYLANKYQADKN